MDLTDGVNSAARLVAFIESSILAEPEDVADARVLSKEIAAGSLEAETRLRAVAERIHRREHGTLPSLTLPNNSRAAQPVLDSLIRFTERMKAELTDAETHAATRRQRWLRTSISMASLSLVLPVAGVLAGALRPTLIQGSNSVVLIAMSSLLMLTVALISFRVQAQADETTRRLQEKLVALSFLENSIGMVDEAGQSAPYVSSALERGFGMFLAHYEGDSKPLGVNDVLPSLPGLKA